MKVEEVLGVKESDRIHLKPVRPHVDNAQATDTDVETEGVQAVPSSHSNHSSGTTINANNNANNHHNVTTVNYNITIRR